MKEKIAWFIFTLKSILMCLALCFVIVVVKSSKNLSFWLEDYRETQKRFHYKIPPPVHINLW